MKSMAEFDCEYLLELSRKKSKARRQMLSNIISDLFDEEGKTLTERENGMMRQILQKIVNDTEKQIRQAIRQKLKSIHQVPRELAQFLAGDGIEVAYSILSQSSLLEDEDLIELIRHRTLEHQLAVAVRNSGSVANTDDMAETDEEAEGENVLVTLLRNSGDEISAAAMEYIIDESKRVDSFRDPILRRDDLDPALAKRTSLWVSAALRKHITDKYGCDQPVLDTILEQAALDNMTPDKTEDNSQKKSERLVAEILAYGTSLTEIMIRALKDGEVTLFETIFQQQTGLRKSLAKRLLFEPGAEGLAIACKASGLTEAEFSTVAILTRMAQSGDQRANEQETQNAIKLFHNVKIETAREVVRLWRRNVDYQSALRDLELTG